MIVSLDKIISCSHGCIFSTCFSVLLKFAGKLRFSREEEIFCPSLHGDHYQFADYSACARAECFGKGSLSYMHARAPDATMCTCASANTAGFWSASARQRLDAYKKTSWSLSTCKISTTGCTVSLRELRETVKSDRGHQNGAKNDTKGRDDIDVRLCPSTSAHHIHISDTCISRTD